MNLEDETTTATRRPVAVAAALALAPGTSGWSALGDALLPSRTMRRRAWPLLLGVGYVAAVAWLGGLRSDHVLVASLALLDAYNERSRRFLRLFFPFILTGVVFDGMRYFYWQGVAGRVHAAEPYAFERAVFGVGGRTLNELFARHHWPALDLACGFAYLAYVAEYLALAFALLWRGREREVSVFAWAFLLVNVMGYVTYFVYPAAPPWYVSQYGLGPVRYDVAPDAAAAHRFDALLGTHFFDSMYGRGVDVFGAYPSLHVAYPLIAAVLAFRFPQLRWARWPAIGFFLLICLSAVYLQHHYVTDVVLGVVYALVAVAVLAPRSRVTTATAS